MKTTIDIQDMLLERARRLAKRSGISLRAVVEDGLRLKLAQASKASTYELEDLSRGDPNAEDPLESLTWQDLRSDIYDEPDPR